MHSNHSKNSSTGVDSGLNPWQKASSLLLHQLSVIEVWKQLNLHKVQKEWFNFALFLKVCVFLLNQATLFYCRMHGKLRTLRALIPLCFNIYWSNQRSAVIKVPRCVNEWISDWKVDFLWYPAKAVEENHRVRMVLHSIYIKCGIYHLKIK